jgi:prophage antirepressor-like protein
MNNELVKLLRAEGLELFQQGGTYFCWGSELAQVLGYRRAANGYRLASRRYVALVDIDTGRGPRKATAVSLPGVVEVVMRTTKPEAVELQSKLLSVLGSQRPTNVVYFRR